MRYLIESRKERKYVKGHRFLYSAKNIGKNLESKYEVRQKFLVMEKKKYFKTASKRKIQKTVDTSLASGLISNKITNKTTEIVLDKLKD